MKSTKKTSKADLKTLTIVALCALPALAALYMTQQDLYLNTSSSLPYGLYKNELKSGSDTLNKNDIALVCLNRQYAKTAYDRGYIGQGRCADGTAPVGKHVIATKGDKVSVSQDGIHVNNKLVDYSTPTRLDSKGRILKPFTIDRVLHDKEYMLANFHKDSYDSRYFGPVQYHMIIGKLKPLFTV